jgi:hypothetical protein
MNRTSRKGIRRSIARAGLQHGGIIAEHFTALAILRPSNEAFFRADLKD